MSDRTNRRKHSVKVDEIQFFVVTYETAANKQWTCEPDEDRPPHIEFSGSGEGFTREQAIQDYLSGVRRKFAIPGFGTHGHLFE